MPFDNDDKIENVILILVSFSLPAENFPISCEN